ncbi:MAG: extracellular solute-binding protein [Proteobacteria bacterium]|nr:extracellular solute-binding protein [Pseudomonadota bacterium]
MGTITEHIKRWIGQAVHRHAVVTRTGLSVLALSLGAAFAPPAAAQSGANFEKQWSNLITAAKKEGRLVLSTGAIPEYQHIFDAFKAKFGIAIVTDGGSGSSRATRILAERRAGRFTVDVGLMSVAANTRRMEPAGTLVDLAPLLIHPDVTDTSKWYLNRHWYVDGKGTKTIFVYSARANNSWRFWYNTDKLSKQDVASLKTPWAFLEPQWKGKMADQSWSDPGRLGGMLEMYFALDAGPQWIKKYFTEMDVIFTGDTRLEESWLIRGRRPLKWDEGDIGNVLRKFMDKFPIAVVEFPRQRGKLEARGSECCINILKKAPHPNAAKLFVNWFLTKEIQTMTHMSKPPRRYTSLRTDGVLPGNTQKIHRRVPGTKYYFRDFDKDYRAKEKAARAFIIKYYQGPKKVAQKHTGKVVQVKRKGRRVTIDYKGKKVMAKLSSRRTKVTINGKPAKRKEVKVGMTCTFVYPGPGKTAKKVDCK